MRFETLEDRQLLTAGGLVAAYGDEGEGEGAGAGAGDAGDVKVFVPDDLVVARGGLFTVPIQFEITKAEGTGISSFDVVIEFEPTIFTVSGSELGSLLAESDGGFDLKVTNPADGVLICMADSQYNSPLFDSGTVNDLFTITFVVASDSPLGPSAINIRAAYNRTSTAMFADDLGELALWPAPTDGTGDSIDGVVTIVEMPQIDMTIVRQPTATGDHGVVASLPTSADWVHEWESFWVELWVSTPDATPAAIAAATVDLHYASDYLTAQEIIYGPAFALDRTGTIDDALGRVGGIGGRTELADVGEDGYALLAWVRFASTGADRVPVDPAGRKIGPYDMQMALANGRTVLVGGGSSVSELGESPGTELWAVLYDVDNNHRIDFGDLAFFAPAFGREVGQAGSEPPYVWWADFDKSGSVDYGDLSFFASGFGKSRSAVQSGQATLVLPPNFPDAWRVEPSGEGEAQAWGSQAVQESSAPVDRRMAGLDIIEPSRVSLLEDAGAIHAAHAAVLQGHNAPYLWPAAAGRGSVVTTSVESIAPQHPRRQDVGGREGPIPRRSVDFQSKPAVQDALVEVIRTGGWNLREFDLDLVDASTHITYPNSGIPVDDTGQRGIRRMLAVGT